MVKGFKDPGLVAVLAKYLGRQNSQSPARLSLGTTVYVKEGKQG